MILKVVNIPTLRSLKFMEKSHFKKAILSLENRIAEHWQKEIKAFERGIEQALKRLGKK